MNAALVPLSLAVTLVLCGCASPPPLVPAAGYSLYMVSKHAGNAFRGIEPLRSEAFREAGQFCKAHGANAQIVKTSESPPPYSAGNLPRIEIHFQCVTRVRPKDPLISGAPPAPAHPPQSG